MRTSATILACAACLTAGLVLGASNVPRQAGVTVPVSADWDRTTTVTELPEEAGYGSTKTIAIVPWRFEEDGKVRDVPDAPRLARSWIVSIDGGRIRVFGTSAK